MIYFSRDAERQHRPETEVEVEAGAFDYHELESDVASQQGCYSPVSSVSDMEPSADHGICGLSTNLQTRWLLQICPKHPSLSVHTELLFLCILYVCMYGVVMFARPNSKITVTSVLMKHMLC